MVRLSLHVCRTRFDYIPAGRYFRGRQPGHDEPNGSSHRTRTSPLTLFPHPRFARDNPSTELLRSHSQGCTHTNTSLQSSTLINSTDCSIYANSNEGCIITNPTNLSYGAPFAAAGGGVWVTEFAPNGINIWFFTVSFLASSVSRMNTDPTFWFRFACV